MALDAKSYNALAVCFKGTEDTAVKELKFKYNDSISYKLADYAVMFNADSEDLARLSMFLQVPQRILRALATANASFSLDETEKSLAKAVADTSFSFLKGKSFKVLCKRIGKHEFSSQDIAVKLGSIIVKKEPLSKASMNNPDIYIYALVTDNKCYIGIDFSGFDLSKRSYKAFSHPDSLNCSIAAAIAYEAYFEYRKKLKSPASKKSNNKGPGFLLLDPFCGSGTIAIEAAIMLSGKCPSYIRRNDFSFSKLTEISFDKLCKEAETRQFSESKTSFKIVGYDFILNYVKSARNNARLAGVDKLVEITKSDIEWLDTKLDNGSVDIIATHPPSLSRNKSAASLIKLYEELFYQAEYVLSETGVIAICTTPDSAEKALMAAVEKRRIRKIKELCVMQRTKKLCLYLFERL